MQPFILCYATYASDGLSRNIQCLRLHLFVSFSLFVQNNNLGGFTNILFHSIWLTVWVWWFWVKMYLFSLHILFYFIFSLCLLLGLLLYCYQFIRHLWSTLNLKKGAVLRYFIDWLINKKKKNMRWMSTKLIECNKACSGSKLKPKSRPLFLFKEYQTALYQVTQLHLCNNFSY